MLSVKRKIKIKKMLKKLEHFVFSFKCPFCNESFKEYMPFGLDSQIFKKNNVVGGGYRFNAVCPVCGSIDRERHIFFCIKETGLILNDRQSILHVAPERKLKEFLSANESIQYISADLNPSGVMVKMDIRDIKYPDAYFNGIVCNHVLEHVVDDRKAMAELYRVLKPGGWAILQVPISLALKITLEDTNVLSSFDRERVFGQRDHVRIYGVDYMNRLEHAGFRIKKYRYSKLHGCRSAYRFGIIDKEEIFVCIKPGIR